MKRILKLAAVVSVALSGSAFAAEAPTCHVEDGSGNTLEATETSLLVEGEKLVLKASGDIFSYSVEVSGAEGNLKLTDSRSGDSAILYEGDFAKGEKVAIGLVTDEEPNSPLKLICVQE